MVEPDNNHAFLPTTDQDFHEHLTMIRLGAWPLIAFALANQLCGGLVLGGIVIIIGLWRGWWCH